MTLPFTLDTQMKVRFVLSDWNSGHASKWRIDEVRLVRP